MLDVRKIIEKRAVAILAGVLGFNLLIAGMAAYVLKQGYAYEYEKARLTAENLSTLIEKRIENDFEKVDIALQSVADEYLHYQQHDPAKFDAWLKSALARHPGLNVLRITDPTGEVIYSPEENRQLKANISDRPYFIRLKADPAAGLQISEPLVGRTTGKAAIVLARRLKTPSGIFSGAVIASIPLDHFQQQFSQLKLGPRDAVALRNGQQKIVVRIPALPGKGDPGSAFMSDAYRAALKLQPEQGFFDSGEGSLDGTDRTYAYRHNARYDFYVNVGLVRQDYLLRWYGAARVTSLVLALFACITLLLTFVLLRTKWRQKTTYEELRKSVARFHAFFDHAMIGMAMTSPDKGWLMVNPALSNMLGYSIDDLRAMTWAELTYPDDLEADVAEFERILRGESEGYCMEKRFVRKDGVIVHAFITARVVRKPDKSIDFFAASIQDVSANHRAFERFQALLAIHELGGNLPEKEFLSRGLVWAEELTASQIGFLHFVSEDQETIELAIWTPGTLKNCTAMYDKHYPINRAGIWADCFYQRKAIAFNNYPAYPSIKRQPDGHVQVERLITVPVIEDGLVRMILGVGNKGDEYDDFDIGTVQLIGNDLWRIISRMRAEQALSSQLVDSQQLNQKLIQAQNQLLQSEKMSSIGQLAAGVAHEINNPIGFVQSNLSSLTDYVDDLLILLHQSEQCAEHLSDPALYAAYNQLRAAKELDFIEKDIHQLLAESRDGVDRVRKIVQSLKDFSHVSEDEWMWADLHHGLDSTLNIVWAEVKYKAEVEKQYGDLPQIYCMPAQLNQVFMNLLVNAAQSMELRGKIVIATGVLPDKQVWIEIRDTGKGIPPEYLSRIFEPFFTTKPVGKGTGLGLSLAYSIIEKHHGQISVDSQAGVGTTFRIVLPINQDGK